MTDNTQYLASNGTKTLLFTRCKTAYKSFYHVGHAPLGIVILKR